MPRRNASVNQNSTHLSRLNLVDLHFHGAFGVDLMRAEHPELLILDAKLRERGVASYCPTTLSCKSGPLLETVSRLGEHILKSRKTNGASRRATPLGIHLEGPFISPAASGAHPKGVLRPASLTELQTLHAASQKTLKILTLAPEVHPAPLLKEIAKWARSQNIILSLGHSRATSEQARQAFELGFSNVTHAFNAMSFHHREPGVMGAAAGNNQVFIEAILDQVHLSPELLRWLQTIHPRSRLCFVSDATPAACLKHAKTPATFGDLTVYCKDGASRTASGELAGGGSLLSEMFLKWCAHEAARTGTSLDKQIRLLKPCVTSSPLRSLRLKI